MIGLGYVGLDEKVSGLTCHSTFFAGCSPGKTSKITFFSTPEIGKIVEEVYATVITAGTHLAPPVKDAG